MEGCDIALYKHKFGTHGTDLTLPAEYVEEPEYDDYIDDCYEYFHFDDDYLLDDELTADLLILFYKVILLEICF